jgi:hypothetical protein
VIRGRPAAGVWLALAVFAALSAPADAGAAVPPRARLVVFDVRGADADETTLVFDQQGDEVRLWMRDALGVRTGEVPLEVFRAGFDALLALDTFALKPEYRGHALRAHAARGSLTLAWLGADGVKNVKTIRYYAPEHTLDDFRSAFNSVWGLSRFAILSLASLESPRRVLREDAVFFLSGTGWMTVAEVRSVLDFQVRRGLGERVARDIWGALDQAYSPQSELASPEFRRRCVRQGLLYLGPDAAAFLERQLPTCPPERRAWAEALLADLRRE